MKGNSCLTNLTDLYDEVTVMVNEGRAVDIVHLIFKKAFNSISCNILTDKLMKCGLETWTVKWTESWMNGQA